MTASQPPLFLPTDSKEIRLMIKVVQDKGYDVRRPQAHHLKIGPYNFFPTTGKITIDPCTRHPQKGFRAYLELLENSIQPIMEISLDNLPDIAPPLAAK